MLRVRIFLVGGSHLGTRRLDPKIPVPRIGETVLLNRNVGDVETKIVAHEVMNVVHDWAAPDSLVDLFLKEFE